MFELTVALFYMAIAVVSFGGGYFASQLWYQHKTFKRYKLLKNIIRQFML